MISESMAKGSAGADEMHGGFPFWERKRADG